MNHHLDGDGFHLTDKQPTWRHHCLSHALSTANFGTASGRAEVWGGPLARGAFVVALLNRGADDGVNITAEWAMLEVPADTTFEVRDLWGHASLGEHTGSFTAPVDSHDIAIFKLTPA
jgi:hypothetical protein